jgi:hypothetical protein
MKKYGFIQQELSILLLAMISYFFCPGCQPNSVEMPSSIPGCGYFGDEMGPTKPCCTATCFADLGMGSTSSSYRHYTAIVDGIVKYHVISDHEFSKPLAIEYGSDIGVVVLQIPRDKLTNNWVDSFYISKGKDIFLAACYDYSDTIRISYALFEDKPGKPLIQTDSAKFYCSTTFF